MIQEWFRSLQAITFARPQYFDLQYIFYAICIGVVFIFAYKMIRRPQRQRDVNFKLVGRDGLWIAVAALIGLTIVVLAGPQSEGFQVVDSSGNLDIVFAFDESFSMAADDVLPSRHELSVKNINDLLVSKAVRSGDRFTLFVFGGDSKWRMPLSDDVGEFKDQILQIEHPKDRIYTDSSQLYTNIEKTIAHIPEALAEQDRYYKTLPIASLAKWFPNQRIVLLFTDGDDFSSFNLVARIYKKLKIPIYVVAVGTSAGTVVRVKIVNQNDSSKLNILNIKTATKTKSLKNIAFGGERGIFILDSGGKSAVNFLNAALSEHRNDLPHFVKKDNPDQFWWPVLASSLVLILAMIIFF